MQTYSLDTYCVAVAGKAAMANWLQQHADEPNMLLPQDAIRTWMSRAKSVPHPTHPRMLLAPAAATAGQPAATAGQTSGSARASTATAINSSSSPSGLQANTTVGLFSVAVVAHGYSYHIAKLHESLALPAVAAPLVVHMSWAGVTKESRLHRLREAKW